MLLFNRAAAAAAILLSRSPIASEAKTNIAIARTFSLNDAASLPDSFDIWDTHPPCNGTASAVVDLFLVFSQSLENSSVARSSIDQIQQRFQETNGWGQCIGRVSGVGVDIDPDLDMYRSNEQETNPLWVSGPNRQFERTVRTLQGGTWGSYEVMILMEMDSVPVKPFWLDAIVNEINSQRHDFAIIGR
jgi:hypothetical protein